MVPIVPKPHENLTTCCRTTHRSSARSSGESVAGDRHRSSVTSVWVSQVAQLITDFHRDRADFFPLQDTHSKLTCQVYVAHDLSDSFCRIR